MSFLGKLFGNDSSNANNEQVICWAVDILNIIEKAGTALSINSCVVQVIAGIMYRFEYRIGMMISFLDWS